ncbi:unnamed protein product, partial [Symbiodinium sp. CCMP2456]
MDEELALEQQVQEKRLEAGQAAENVVKTALAKQEDKQQPKRTVDEVSTDVGGLTATELESSKKPRSEASEGDVAARRAELERLDRLVAEKKAELLLQDFESRARSETERKAREAELKAREEAELRKEAELQKAREALEAEQAALEAELKARAEARLKAQAERAAREEAAFQAQLAEQRLHANAELEVLRKKKEAVELNERQRRKEETLRLLEERKAKVRQLKLQLQGQEQAATGSTDPSSPRPSALKRSSAFEERSVSFLDSKDSPSGPGPVTPLKALKLEPAATPSPRSAPSEASLGSTQKGDSGASTQEGRSWETATPEEWATLTQNCRRCCHNYQRASMEMVQAWEAGGTVRKELLKRWWSNPNVATVTAEIL